MVLRRKFAIPFAIFICDEYLLHIEEEYSQKRSDFSLTYPIPKYVK